MPFVTGTTHMIGCGQDRELMNSFPLFPFTLRELFGKLLHLAFCFLFKFPQGRFLFPDLIQIPFQLHPIIVNRRLRLGSRRAAFRSPRKKIAST